MLILYAFYTPFYRIYCYEKLLSYLTIRRDLDIQLAIQ